MKVYLLYKSQVLLENDQKKIPHFAFCFQLSVFLLSPSHFCNLMMFRQMKKWKGDYDNEEPDIVEDMSALMVNLLF